MRRTKNVLAVGVAVGALVASLAACSSSKSSSSTSAAAAASGGSSSSGSATGSDVGCDKAKGKVVGYSEPLPDPNFQFIEKIINTELQKYGATLKAVNANLDPGKQVTDINTLVQSGVAALIANPIDPNSTRGSFDRARAQNIPIIAQETTIGGPFATNVTGDLEGAATAGAALLKQKVGSGNVTAITGPSFAEVLVREATAFKNAAHSNGLNVVDTKVNQQITPQAAQGFATAWKDKYGDALKGIWTFNDTSAVGAASAFPSNGPAIVSINGEPQVIPLITSGKVLASYDIQQDKLGQALAYSALSAICGKDLPKEIVIPVKVIDSSNVASYRPLAARVNDPFDVQFEQKDGRTFLKS